MKKNNSEFQIYTIIKVFVVLLPINSSTGLFLNGRSEKVAKKKMFDPAVGKVWPPLPQDKEFEGMKGWLFGSTQ